MPALSALAPRWRGALVPLLLVLFALLGAARAQAQAPSVNPALERQVKAAYLLKFAAFVEWPDASFARPDSVLEIGVAGNGPLADALTAMAATRTINGHPVAVRRIRAGDALAGLHILFVDGETGPGAARELLTAAQGLALLTVSDAAEQADSGCMINFVVDAERLRFDVLMRPVAASGLRISARMLAVAHRVRGAS